MGNICWSTTTSSNVGNVKKKHANSTVTSFPVEPLNRYSNEKTYTNDYLKRPILNKRKSASILNAKTQQRFEKYYHRLRRPTLPHFIPDASVGHGKLTLAHTSRDDGSVKTLTTYKHVSLNRLSNEDTNVAENDNSSKGFLHNQISASLPTDKNCHGLHIPEYVRSLHFTPVGRVKHSSTYESKDFESDDEVTIEMAFNPSPVEPRNRSCNEHNIVTENHNSSLRFPHRQNSASHLTDEIYHGFHRPECVTSLTNTSVGHGKRTSSYTFGDVESDEKVTTHMAFTPSPVEPRKGASSENNNVTENDDSSKRFLRRQIYASLPSDKNCHGLHRPEYVRSLQFTPVGRVKHSSTYESKDFESDDEVTIEMAFNPSPVEPRNRSCNEHNIVTENHNSSLRFPHRQNSASHLTDEIYHGLHRPECVTSLTNTSVGHGKRTLSYTLRDVECDDKVTTDMAFTPSPVEPLYGASSENNNVTENDDSSKRFHRRQISASLPTDKNCHGLHRPEYVRSLQFTPVGRVKHTSTYESKDFESDDEVTIEMAFNPSPVEPRNRSCNEHNIVTENHNSSLRFPHRQISASLLTDEIYHGFHRPECVTSLTNTSVGHGKRTSSYTLRDVESDDKVTTYMAYTPSPVEPLYGASSENNNVTENDDSSKRFLRRQISASLPTDKNCHGLHRPEYVRSLQFTPVGRVKHTSTYESNDFDSDDEVTIEMAFNPSPVEPRNRSCNEHNIVTENHNSSLRFPHRQISASLLTGEIYHGLHRPECVTSLTNTSVGHGKRTSSYTLRDVESDDKVTTDMAFTPNPVEPFYGASSENNNVTENDDSSKRFHRRQISASLPTDENYNSCHKLVGHKKHTSTYPSRDVGNDNSVTTDTDFNTSPFEPIKLSCYEHQGVMQMHKSDSLLKLLFSPSFQNTIEKDSMRILILFNAVCEGEWRDVMRILGTPSKPHNDHLINVIPEDKTFGVLHYAVDQNRTYMLRTLLRFKSCDKWFRSRKCELKNGKNGKWNALELADVLGHGQCADILSTTSQHGTHKHLDTFCNLEIDTGTFSLLNIALAIYKKTFHPGFIAPNVNMFDLLERVFQNINESEERWMLVKTQVCSSIENTDQATYETLRNSQTREDFYKAMIKVYTSEHNSRLYTELNDALRRQNKSNYSPTATDLERSPFVLMYEMILLYWDKLGKESENTYRRMLLTDKDLALYQVGVEFIWMSFVSSSRSESHSQCFPTCYTKGENVTAFTLINRQHSDWQPRNIERYASYSEYERTYPAGARFKIIKRETRPDCTHVTITLMND